MTEVLHSPAEHPNGQGDPRGFLPSAAGYLEHVIEAIRALDHDAIARVAALLWRAWEEDRAVYIVGNGGSASTATHMACDLAKQTQLPGRRPLRAFSLNDNQALLTAFANDTDYSRVFAEALAIYAREGDVLVAISCSGRSPNIIAAIDTATIIGMKVVTLGSRDGGPMGRHADLAVNLPSDDYGTIESAHLVVEHCLTYLLYEYGKLRMERRPAVFVDRDGVIVRNRNDYVKSWDEVEVIPGAVEALARLSKSGHRVFVVTNQSAVSRGLISRAGLDDIHERISGMVESMGGRIEAFLVCPHHPDENCGCRKPNPGLLMEARDRYGVDLTRTVLIGDHETDLEAAASAGVDAILVLSGRARTVPINASVRHVAHDLRSATEYLLAN